VLPEAALSSEEKVQVSDTTMLKRNTKADQKNIKI